MVLPRAPRLPHKRHPKRKNRPKQQSSNILATALTPSSIDLVPGVEDQLTKVAEQFLVPTQALAAVHFALQRQQRDQSQAHIAALMAVQDSTENSMKYLTDQQLPIAGRFQDELVATQSAIRQ
ncbi:LOW QUALITY PROTEIN: hypothetical protein PHPALM_14097 [Phytophthora palmivora]|uniref:Phasin domain-containing protein n=1 Tax=Phytophthora palmivora TaxID=4796 RepID=A0A2P4XVL8_9STRA|nr:LOW QUALITY PROTEIN: hypothetical protein PHPALM_14097 [Phytophthora palmivora]